MEVYTGNTKSVVDGINKRVLVELKFKNSEFKDDKQFSSVIKSEDDIYAIFIRPNEVSINYRDIFLSVLSDVEKNNITTITKDDSKWFSDVINKNNAKLGL